MHLNRSDLQGERQAMKTVAYLSVSPAKQDAGSQHLAILEHARSEGLSVDVIARAGVTFIAIKENIRFKGQSDIQTKVMTTMFALFAEVECDLISERTREGLVKARASGKKLGRPQRVAWRLAPRREGARNPPISRTRRLQDRGKNDRMRFPRAELRAVERFAKNTCLSWRVLPHARLGPYLSPDPYTNTPQLSSYDKMRHPRVFQGLFPA